MWHEPYVSQSEKTSTEYLVKCFLGQDKNLIHNSFSDSLGELCFIFNLKFEMDLKYYVNVKISFNLYAYFRCNLIPWSFQWWRRNYCSHLNNFHRY
jgi:hypothetical protein